MNNRNKTIIKKIKKQTGVKNFRDGMLAAHFICRPLSRVCSLWFINENIKPNQITLLMIIFGITGSIIFAIPNGICKIIGYIFWILWFTMDLSDGQVARYNKIFSQFGTEMDYMAHLIDHSMMNIAIWLTFLQMNIIDPVLLSIIFIICISFELINRNIIAFIHYRNFIPANLNSNNNKSKTSWSKYLLTESILYPTMIICFSWIIVLDYFLSLGFSLWLFIFWVSIYSLNAIRNIINILKYFSNN